MRHQIVRFRLGQALAHRALDAHQAGAELVLRQFAYRPHAAVAEMVDVVNLAPAVAQFNQDPDDGNDVFRGKCACAHEFRTADAAIEFHPADR